jgi:Xaa-Pro aminopeptidase
VRIEDDVAVTARGNEVLTAALPKDVATVQALCAA